MLYFYVYPSAFQNPGGGEVLLLKTKEYLEKAGIPVKLFDLWNDRFKAGDVLHVFGSVKEALGLMETAKSKGVKIVHSPVIWYNWQSSLKIAYGTKEKFLSALRHVAKVFFPVIPSERKKMMALADIVLAGSEMEAEQIRRFFLIPGKKIKVIHYGVDTRFKNSDPRIFESRFKLRNFVLMAGRIEPRKNQLHFIRAMNSQPCEAVIVGRAVSGHQNYETQCRREAAPNIHFIDHLSFDGQELPSAYAAAKVFALPSWFETPGLAAMEAGVAGANLVVTREGSTQEYFQAFADYADPESVADIREKILNAWKKPKKDILSEHIQKNFSWERNAERTREIYQSLGLKTK